MADSTAAFFAKKKKGKKKPKSFNANKVDVSMVSSTVHIDAPPIAGSAPTPLNIPSSSESPHHQPEEKVADEEEEWASSAPQEHPKSVVVTQKSNAVAELLDMNALEERHKNEDDIQERMRVEETRKALARAREGMEKEARRLKEEQNKKEEKPPQRPAVAAAVGSSSGKWIPPHLRNAAAVPLRQPKIAGGRVPNTEDEAAFPDLAAANELLEKQKKEQEQQMKAKKMGGGAVWGGGFRGGALASASAAPTDRIEETRPKPYVSKVKEELAKLRAKNDPVEHPPTPPKPSITEPVVQPPKPSIREPVAQASKQPKQDDSKTTPAVVTPTPDDKAPTPTSPAKEPTSALPSSDLPKTKVSQESDSTPTTADVSTEKQTPKKKKKKKKDLSTFKPS